MSKPFTVSETIDARGLSCPLPIIKARKAMDRVEIGDVLEILATDKGSVADFRSFAAQTGHELIESKEEEGVYRHYLRKAQAETQEKERTYPYTLSNDELLQKIEANEPVKIVDVREPHEFNQARIPGAILVPVEELDGRADTLSHDDEIAVVCRSARRSDYACQILHNKGFKNVKNVVPGMIGWTGPIVEGDA